MSSTRILKILGATAGAAGIAALAYKSYLSRRQKDVPWYRGNLPHVMKTSSDVPVVGSIEGQQDLNFKGESLKLFLRGPSTFLNRVDFERSSDEAVMEIIKEVSNTGEIDLAITAKLVNIRGQEDPLITEPNKGDEEGEAQDVSSIHYCNCCGKGTLQTLSASGRCEACINHQPTPKE